MRTYTFRTVAGGRAKINAGSGFFVPKSNPGIFENSDSVLLNFQNEDDLIIYPANDTVIIDGVTHAAGSWSVTAMSDAINVLFPKANTGNGGTGLISNSSVAYVDALGNNTTGSLSDPSKPFATIQAAINALPSTGGIVRIGIGTFNAPTSLTKANIVFQGSGRPSPNWTVTQSTSLAVTYSAPTALTGGGTIIKGTMAFLDMSGIKIKDLGIDVGSAYVTAGGTEGNGLSFSRSISNETANTPAPPYDLMTGIEVDNLTILCRNATSLFHGLVIEDCYKPQVSNILNVYGSHGLAIKTIEGFYTNIVCHNNNLDGIIIKNNAYSIAAENIVSCFIINNSGSGVVLENKSSSVFRDNTISNGYINNCTTGVKTFDNFAGGFAALVVNNVRVRGATTSFANTTNYSIINCFDGDAYTQNVIASTSTTTYHSSTFTAANGTALTAYTPEIGGAWSQDLGTWQITGNTATSATVSGTDAQAYTTVSPQNYVLSCVANVSNTASNVQFYLRATNSSNGVIVHVSNIAVNLYNAISGTFNLVSSANYSRGTGSHTYIISISGTAVTVKSDGSIIFTGTLPNQTNAGSRAGIGIAGSSTAGTITYDNFTITNQ